MIHPKIRIGITNTLYKIVPLIAFLKDVLGMCFGEIDVFDRRARGKVIAELPRLGFSCEDLNRMIDIKLQLHLSV